MLLLTHIMYIILFFVKKVIKNKFQQIVVELFINFYFYFIKRDILFTQVEKNKNKKIKIATIKYILKN